MNNGLVDAKSIVASLRRTQKLELQLKPTRFLAIFPRSIRFQILGGHDLLTDSADWNADTWDMDKAGLEDLAALISDFANLTKRSFLFKAIWIGDEPRSQVQFHSLIF